MSKCNNSKDNGNIRNLLNRKLSESVLKTDSVVQVSRFFILWSHNQSVESVLLIYNSNGNINHFLMRKHSTFIDVISVRFISNRNVSRYLTRKHSTFTDQLAVG